MIFPDDTPLGEARKWVEDNLEEGIRCPCCNRHVKIYPRQINKGMAMALIAMYRAGGITEFVHVPVVSGRRSSEEAKMVHWGLIEEERAAREDGGRAGWWRVTRLGEFYLKGLALPKYARLHNTKCLGLSGPDMTISDALKTPFDLRELMGP